ncbi:MAG: carboxypeptidase regulatory-like domain-containing protein [Thermoanaerobaculia bacterium]|nr:carboxypeptidase regulatory-like domain-containing protein [Thermoanaerobaculia bacterium]
MRGRLLAVVLCLVVAVSSSAAITGTVVNSDGLPVAGAKVTLHSLETAEARRIRLVSDKPERVALASIVSDAKGKFSFDSPKEPVADIQIVAAGYAPVAFAVERDEDTGAVPLFSAPLKQGRITANGKPVAGAQVVFLASGAEVLATTDAEGRYSMPDPARWADRYSVSHKEFARSEGTTFRSATEKIALDQSLTAGVTVSGRVVGENGKTAVAGATLFVGGNAIGKSGEDGTFALEHVSEKWDWLEARSGALLGTRSRAGDPAIVIRLGKTGSITGHVRDAKSQAGIAGATVALMLSAGRMPMPFSAITDAKGAFSLLNLAPGKYELLGSRPGYRPAPVSITLAAGEKASKNLSATQLARVSGTVINEDKQPIAGARVSQTTVTRDVGFFSRPISQQQRRVSAPDGTFVLRVDSETDIQIDGSKKGFPSANTTAMRLAPGERKSGVTITIPAGMLVTGRVTDRDERPVAGVAVAAVLSVGMDVSSMRRMVFGGSRGREDDQVQTAADGTFSIRLKEGSYDVNFKREGFAMKTVRAFRVNNAPQPIEVKLDPGVEVRGRVTRSGAGVAGVRVIAFAEGANASTETSADGSFTLGDLTPGTIQLNFGKEDEFIQQMRQVSAPSNDFLLELPPGGRVVGRVVDKTTRQPVTTFEAGVSPFRGGGGMVFMGSGQTKPFTSESGSFVLDNIPSGQTIVIAKAPGYTTGRVSNVAVEEGKSTQEIEVALEHGVRARGKVTGPEGSPLAGVEIRIDVMGGRITRGSFNDEQATTDASGEFTFDNLEPGERAFVFSKPGMVGTTKTITLSGSETRVDAQLSSGVRITGVVVTEAGSPVADAMVTATSSAGAASGRGMTSSDANGNFQLEALAPGRYNFNASKRGEAPGQLRDFDIASGAPARIVMKAGGVISGRVIGLSADEMQQAAVGAQSPNGNAMSPVDANGNYRIEGAPTGTVRLSARTSGTFGMGKTSPQVSVQLEPGGSATADIEFKSGTVVRGRVTREGRPLADLMMMFSPRGAEAQTSAHTTTDRDGYFEVTGLDDATYDVSVVDIQRGAPYSTTYKVKGSGTFDIDMRSATMRGRVVDAATGSPIGDATIDVRGADNDGPRFPLRTVQTDASGVFVIDAITPGTYNVSAEKADYGTKTSSVTVGDSGGEVELKLARNDGVLLRVVDGRDGRALRALVRVVDAQNRVVFESMRFAGGAAEALRLPLDAGTYRANVWAYGYASQMIALSSPSNPTVALTPGGSIVVQSKGSVIRRARLVGADGRPYERGPGIPFFTIDAGPGVTTLENIAPGTYALQILGNGDSVEASAQVTVGEGQRASAEI